MLPGSKIRIGTAGWSYKDWEGVFYPPGMSRRKQHPLALVARCFDVVEINTSFYGHIKPEIAALWSRIVSEVNPNFMFTAKLHRSFTHSPLAALEPTSHVTSALGYVRLHGRNYEEWFEAETCADRYNYLYKPNELAGWKERVENIAQQAKTTFVVANNHFEAKAGVNALQLKHMF